ncbi:MAG TPA: cupin domain-containing protein [Solirubrobacteraceae bacterium]|jgi:mannose-6-phosphate isomerase-like protein (cupin superfamily)|nr:cupin domain-containing protein [Solirubrobacteraceae bacterium]
MTHTIKNLSETADSAVKFGLSDMGEAHFPREELGAESTGLSYQVLKPGKRQSFGHRHDKAEEVYVVLAGSGRVRLDDEIVDIARLDAIRVEPRVTRAFEAGPDGLEWVAFGPHHDGDGELDHEFWKD